MILKVLLVWLVVAVVRISRWASIVQQKEYRWDRISLFLKTQEGAREIEKFWWRKTDFTRTGLKRPHITPRVIVVTGLVVLMAAVVLVAEAVILSSLMLHLVPQLVGLVIMGFALWVLVPYLFIVAILPTSMLRNLIVNMKLISAQRTLEDSKPTIIGITGSYGKTSTKLLLSHVLSQKFSVFATPKSFNAAISVAGSIKKGYKNQEIAVLEYGAYRPGEIQHLAEYIQPAIAIVTGFTCQHLGLFGSEQGIIDAKSELVAALPDDGKVFFAGDTEGVQAIVSKGVGKRKIEQTEYLESIGSSISAVKLKKGNLEFKWNNHTITTQLLGVHYLSACCAVIAVAQDLGLSDKEIVAGLESFEPGSEFVSRLQLADGTVVIDDGSTSNPAGFEVMLDIVRAIRAQKKVLVFGGIVDLAGQSQAVHTDLAKIAEKLFDEVWYTGAVGSEEFKNVFGKRFVRVSSVEEIPDQLGKGSLLVLEGKMQPWILNWMKN